MEPLPTTSSVHLSPFEIFVDNRPVRTFEGQTLAGCLTRAGYRAFGRHEKTGARRGLFCGIGQCHQCLVTVDGRPGVRACQTLVRPGMEVLTGLEGPEMTGSRS